MMSEKLYDAKYVLQTVLRKFPVKDLRVENQLKYRIDMKVMDDVHDVIYFLVDKSDVFLNKDDTCDVILTQDEYSVHYFYMNEEMDMIRRNISRCTITDAYYRVYPERNVFGFDLMCIPSGAISELDSEFALRVLSYSLAQGSFITFTVPKKSLYWVHNEYAGKEYAHVDLKRHIYELTFKNKDTRWKDKVIEVSKEDLIQDFIHAKRSYYYCLSPKVYQERLLDSYAYSCLFANL